MTLTLSIPGLLVCIAAFFLLIYLQPFIISIWLPFSSRRQGRKIGRVHLEKIENYTIVQGANDNPVPTIDNHATVASLTNNFIAAETSRLEQKYNPRIASLEAALKKIETAKNATIATFRKDGPLHKLFKKGNHLFESQASDYAYWRLTLVVWGIVALLLLDTYICGEWIAQVGIFGKSQLLFESAMTDEHPFLKPLNFSLNSIIGFTLNIGLLLIMHALFNNTTLPAFLQKSNTKLAGGILVIALVVVLRFLLPNSGAAIKNIMLIVIWLLLFASSYILLHNSLKKMQSVTQLFGYLFFFLVVPLSILSLVTGGVTAVAIKAGEGLVSGFFELKKAGINRRKENLVTKKENLEDGIYEGASNEVRE